MIRSAQATGFAVVLVAAAVLIAGNDVRAHGGGNWDPFTIDVVNDKARQQIARVQAITSEIILGRKGGDEWPLASFRETRNALITDKESVDEVLEHLVNEGTNVQAVAVLHAEPRVGRTVAASRALDAAIALIEHAAALESADALIAEFYAAGLAGKLYELLEAHGDRMDLYAALTDAGD